MSSITNKNNVSNTNCSSNNYHINNNYVASGCSGSNMIATNNSNGNFTIVNGTSSYIPVTITTGGTGYIKGTSGGGATVIGGYGGTTGGTAIGTGGNITITTGYGGNIYLNYPRHFTCKRKPKIGTYYKCDMPFLHSLEYDNDLIENGFISKKAKYVTEGSLLFLTNITKTKFKKTVYIFADNKGNKFMFLYVPNFDDKWNIFSKTQVYDFIKVV